jgi:hypothetical protein
MGELQNDGVGGIFIYTHCMMHQTLCLDLILKNPYGHLLHGKLFIHYITFAYAKVVHIYKFA